MRVKHFSHVLEPPRTKKMWCGRCATKKKIIFFQHHFRVFFGRIAHKYVKMNVFLMFYMHETIVPVSI